MKEIISSSLSRFHGTCPCPYNVDRAGHTCGSRSEYTRRGRRFPICYPSDVTRGMIESYRRGH